MESWLSSAGPVPIQPRQGALEVLDRAAAQGGYAQQARGMIGRLLAELHGLPPAEVQPHLYCHHQADAVRHLFRVAASLDSLVIGEGQIAGQIKRAYEVALAHGSPGPLLNVLFPHARRVARRVRTETGIARGRVSVSSAAVDYVRQVFDHFGDKTVLVIGAGKMGGLTLRRLLPVVMMLSIIAGVVQIWAVRAGWFKASPGEAAQSAQPAR